MKISALLLALVASEKMTTEVAESSNMQYVTNRAARNNACLPVNQCLNPYCSLYDCYEKNNKPLCNGETKDVANTPEEAKVGIHHNIPERFVSSWSLRLNERYSAQHGRDMRNIISDWNTNNNWMFVAAQYVNDRGNDYYLGAFAPTKRVFSRCNNSRHSGYRTLGSADCIHGTYWYCVINWSFGFSAHNQVRLSSADTFGLWGGNSPGQSNNHRLSWHMHYNYNAGWRAGMAHSMNNEQNMYKIVRTKLCNGCGQSPTAYPTASPTPYPTAYPTGILDHATCASTTCVYSNGQTEIFAKSLNGVFQENFHCEKVGNGCKCVCNGSLKCALRHHHTSGYKKTFEHC